MTTGDSGTTRVEPGVSVPEQRYGPTAGREAAAERSTREGGMWDRIRWGPIWAGATIVVPTFLVLQLLFFALGWLDLGFTAGASAAAASIVSGILALIAFFVGGLMTGASTIWRNTTDGVMHGVLMWALSVVGILVLALTGGSALLGPLATVAAQAPGIVPPGIADPDQFVNAARNTAGWTALALGLSVAAAALGGLIGSKLWPGKEERGQAGARREAAHAR